MTSSRCATILRQTDPTVKAEVYRQLGIKLTYKPGLRLIQAEASPSGSCTKVCPEIDTNQYPISADLGPRPYFSLTALRLRRTPPKERQTKVKQRDYPVRHHAKQARCPTELNAGHQVAG
jgi:hypothetical protein